MSSWTLQAASLGSLFPHHETQHGRGGLRRTSRHIHTNRLLLSVPSPFFCWSIVRICTLICCYVLNQMLWVLANPWTTVLIWAPRLQEEETKHASPMVASQKKKRSMPFMTSLHAFLVVDVWLDTASSSGWNKRCWWLPDWWGTCPRYSLTYGLWASPSSQKNKPIDAFFRWRGVVWTVLSERRQQFCGTLANWRAWVLGCLAHWYEPQLCLC